ncbi:MAG: PilN domain-containing protein [Gammaproteobacteria bacterium]
MPRVNLLPWREELRKQRQQSFMLATLGAVLLGAIIVFGTRAFYQGKVEHQSARNQFLKKEIAVLDVQIKEIETLESVKERTLARMDVIETLQRSRPEVVHLFDELAGSVPDGVHLESVRQAGTRVTITGVAQSSTRVSAFMRNLDRSDWLTNPGLDVVQTAGRDGSDRASTFTIFATQTRPKSDDPEDEEG